MCLSIELYLRLEDTHLKVNQNEDDDGMNLGTKRFGCRNVDVQEAVPKNTIPCVENGFTSPMQPHHEKILGVPSQIDVGR